MNNAAEKNVNVLLDRVCQTAQTTPQAPAYRRLGSEPVSYASLWETSGKVAALLAQLAPNRMPVVVFGSKGPLMVEAFLGCLRSGHAYVPVDGSMPLARLTDIAAQLEACCQSPVLVLACDQACARAVSETELAFADLASCLDGIAAPSPAQAGGERDQWVGGEDTQYLIFTSGSTGRPKGIEVSATDVDNFVGWLEGFPTIREGGRTFMDQAPYSFDLSVYQLAGALATGGCLYAISPEASHDYALLFEELRDADPDVWVSTPPFADLCLVDHSFGSELIPNVGLFLFCGDTLRHRTAQSLRERFPKARVANTYGPTESTVAVTYCEIDDDMLASKDALPVGFARPGTELRIMRRAEDGVLLDECEAGETGEIVIVGDTVAKGYLGDPKKTMAAFDEDRLSDGTTCRSFRTGDLGHLGPDGNLHYEGRMGSLVKVNGFRIELGDVENSIAGLGGIKSCAVVPVERGGSITSLKAFVVLDHKVPAADESPRELRRRLAERVPAYMVPRSIKVLDDMPLTNNAKIDRKTLIAG